MKGTGMLVGKLETLKETNLGVAHSPSAEIRKFGFMAHFRGTPKTCLILILNY